VTGQQSRLENIARHVGRANGSAIAARQKCRAGGAG
jgi:hypothetical protein